LFIGGTSSPQTLSILPILKDAGVFYTGGTGKDQAILLGGGRVISLNSNGESDGQAIAKYLSDTLGAKKIAFVSLEGGYTNLLLKTIKTSVSNGTVVSDYIMPLDTQNFQSTVTNLNAIQPDAVLVGIGAQTQIVAFMRQLKQSGFSKPIVISPGLLFPSLVKAGGGAFEGVVTGDIWTPSQDNDANRRFKESFKTYGSKHQVCDGLKLDKQIALTYSQIVLLAEVAKRAGSADSALLYKTARDGEWSLPQGIVRFDAAGRAQHEYKYLTVKDGEMVPLQ
jgi:branched-chain amino acid transport system substrate-binding protein